MPRIPGDDAEVLQRVPVAGEARALEVARQHLTLHGDEQGALELAQGYLRLGRMNADPRFVSYAQATLVPWLKRDPENTALLNLQAAALQYLHHFDQALGLLDRVTQREPLNGQAWLTKATLLQVQGNMEGARAACRPLIRASGQLIALTCLASVDSLTGHLKESRAALRSIYRDDASLGPELRIWILEVLSDMAMRSGDAADAGRDLREALQLSPADPFARAAYADVLLSQHRESEVIGLLRDAEQQDNLLLRLAIAGTRLGLPEATRWSTDFQARSEAARRDGDMTHLREQARFQLEVRHDSAAALVLAQRNWEVQREPADIQIYVQAARAQHREALLRPVLHWIQQTGYEDAALAGAPVAGATALANR